MGRTIKEVLDNMYGEMEQIGKKKKPKPKAKKKPKPKPKVAPKPKAGIKSQSGVNYSDREKRRMKK